MVYAGAIASGAIAGQTVSLFGHTFDVRVARVPRDGDRRHGRLPRRRSARLGDRPSRRQAVPRAPRALAPSRSRQAGAGRSLVPALGGLGGPARAHHARRAVVRLHPGRHLRGAAPALHRADAHRVGAAGASCSQASAGRPARAGRASTARSASPTSRSRCSWSVAASSGSAGARPRERVAPARADVRRRSPRSEVFPAPGGLSSRRSVHSDLVIPLVDVKAQYAPLIPELKERFAEVLESGRFIFGPEVEAFERESAAYLDVPHAIGVANGTDALVLSLEAMGIGAGDEVICPSFTFYATAEAIARVGATPVFADIDPVTLNLDPEDVGGADHAEDEGDHAGAPVRPPGAARRARGARAAADRGLRAGVRRRGRRERGRLLDVQLLPDEEPVRARRRRARHLSRRRGGRARPHAALPRLARQADVRAHRHELAARCDPGGGAPRLPARTWRAGTRPPRGCCALRGARPRRRRSRFRSTSRATSTTCTSSEPPTAPGSLPR